VVSGTSSGASEAGSRTFFFGAGSGISLTGRNLKNSLTGMNLRILLTGVDLISLYGTDSGDFTF